MQSRQVHYITFCTKASLRDPCLSFAPVQTRNYVLACYVVYLIQGNTLTSIFIRSNTLTGYVKAAVALHKERNLPHPIQACGSADLVQPLIASLKSYESVPDRREMIYDNMLRLMLKTCSLHSDDSLERSILDWIILGRVTGARKSEWCQDSQQVAMIGPNIHNIPQQPLAFIAEDFTFHSKDLRIIHKLSSTDLASVSHLTVRWRFQKNDNNGEKIPFARDWKRPHICPVLAASRIFLRAKRLRVPPTSPLAVCSSDTSRGFSYITSSQTTVYLRRHAQTAFGLKPTDPVLNKWSCHSIRVTAANLLHRAKMSDSYIQTRLRWKSTAFLEYLRNTFYSATLHTEALALSPDHLPTITTLDGKRHRTPDKVEAFVASTKKLP